MKQIEERRKSLKQRKEQFRNNRSTVLKEIDHMRREINGIKLEIFEEEEEQFGNTMAPVQREIHLM